MFHQAISKVARSTVGVLATWTDNQNPATFRHCELVGSGFFLADCMAVTARHVVDHIVERNGLHDFGGKRWFGLLTSDGFDESGTVKNAKFEWARVLASSSDHDAAILFVPGSKVVPVEIAVVEPTIGDHAGALGYPLARNMPTQIEAFLRFTGGYVSNARLDVLEGAAQPTSLFEVDSMFIPGISGGPVFQQEGKVFALTHGTVSLGEGLLTLALAVGIKALVPLLREVRDSAELGQEKPAQPRPLAVPK